MPEELMIRCEDCGLVFNKITYPECPRCRHLRRKASDILPGVGGRVEGHLRRRRHHRGSEGAIYQRRLHRDDAELDRLEAVMRAVPQREGPRDDVARRVPRALERNLHEQLGASRLIVRRRPQGLLLGHAELRGEHLDRPEGAFVWPPRDGDMRPDLVRDRRVVARVRRG